LNIIQSNGEVNKNIAGYAQTKFILQPIENKSDDSKEKPGKDRENE
jgi:hypothetical protein